MLVAVLANSMLASISVVECAVTLFCVKPDLLSYFIGFISNNNNKCTQKDLATLSNKYTLFLQNLRLI